MSAQQLSEAAAELLGLWLAENAPADVFGTMGHIFVDGVPEGERVIVLCARGHAAKVLEAVTEKLGNRVAEEFTPVIRPVELP